MSLIRMSLVVVAIACIASVVVSDNVPQYPPLVNTHSQPSPYKAPARPYSYSYAVEDQYLGNKFGAHEESDGQIVIGSYQVDLPDGRIQDVSYTSDHENGYIAAVSYKGEALHPPPSSVVPSGYQPPAAPAHPPQPSPPAPYNAHEA